MDRAQIFTTLSALVPGDFEKLLFTLHPPPGLVPGATAAQAMRVSALLEWTESSTGRGLEEVEELFGQLASLPSPPQACPNSLPRSGTKKFVGRETELTNLHTQLHQVDRLAITALRGMGGIGKTELALQYAMHHLGQGTYPGGICWLQAKEQDIGTEIVNFALIHLKLTPPDGLELPNQVAYIWQHWPTPGNVLVAIDDVSGPDDNTAYANLKPYLPPQGTRFRVLLTTRLQLGASIQTVQIDVLSEAASLDLLRSLVSAERIDQELYTAKALCHWLGYLPLGLELVGRFLARKPGWMLAKMQQRLNDNRLAAKALCQAHPDMTATHESIAAAFELSWQDLEPEAQELAYRLSLYALAPIDWQWIENWYEGTDPDDLEDWRDEGLGNRSLLAGDGQGDTWQLHQIIREFFRTKLDQGPGGAALKQCYCQRMVQVAQGIPDNPTRDQILVVAPVIPHLAEAAITWQQWLDDESLGWPFTGLGRFYEGQGAYGQAEHWWQSRLAVTHDRLGDNHPDVATSMNNLAVLYKRQGHYNGAELLFQNALSLRQRLLNDDNPDVATSINNLANLYEFQGRYSEAELLYEQAIAIGRKAYGEEHPEIAIDMNNLANLYKSQGRYSESELLYKQALAIDRKAYGEENLEVAIDLNNLAALYRLQRRYGEAETLSYQAFYLYQKLLGNEHPDVATSMNNLAAIYKAQSRHTEAERLYRDALSLRQRFLGNNHSAVATSMNNLADLYRSQGRYSEAEPCAVQALQISASALGQEHLDVGISLSNLASLRVAQGKFSGVEAMILQAFSIFVNSVGVEHSYTTETINRLGNFVATVQAAEQTIILSNHPLTQNLLQQVQGQ